MKNENVFVIAILILVLLFLFWNFGGMMPYRDYGMMGSYWTYGFGWMGVFMWLIWILVTVTLTLLIIWLVKQIQKR